MLRVAALRLVIAAVGPAAVFAGVVEPEHLRVVLSTGVTEGGRWSLAYPGARQPGRLAAAPRQRAHTRPQAELVSLAPTAVLIGYARCSTERCLREAHVEPAPVHDCTCGLYAFHEPWTVATWYASRPGSSVPGVMLAWGRIEASFGGLRSQFARLVCLGLPAFADRDRKRAIYAEAERQGIQVAPLKHLAKVASAAGGSIPSSLRGDP